MAGKPESRGTDQLLQAIRAFGDETNERLSAEAYRQWQANHSEAPPLPVLRKWIGSWETVLRRAFGEDGHDGRSS